MSSVHWLARCTCIGCTLGLLGSFTTACSDPVTPPPQGAFEATFSGSACAATVDPGPTISIGTAKKTESATYADGAEGIHIGCRVVPQGDNYYTKIRIARGSTLFELEATMPNVQDKSANATIVRISGPNTAGGTYLPSANVPCTVRFYEGAPGRIKASFDCTSMETQTSTAGAICGVNGFFVGENCDQE